MRTSTGRSSGQAVRTTRATSSVSRARPSKSPPQPSVRRLLIGDRNECSRYPCAAWISATWKPAATARRAALANASITRAMPASSSARGIGYTSLNGIALGAITSTHPPSATGTARAPSHGRVVLALRPACASWIPTAAPCARTKSVMRRSGATCASSQSPRSWRLMRPSGTTAVASVSTSPAPPVAKPPRWTKCQSLAMPSVAEYWHIGATPMRLRSVSERSVNGEKSTDMGRQRKTGDSLRSM